MEPKNSLDYIAELTEKEDELPQSTPMKNFIRGKTIFLTGGTGFLGQLYVNKLLSCEAKCIYLLARPKRGVDPKERIETIFTGTHFAKLYAQDKDFADRITIVEGDIMQLQLGISKNDMKDIIENVELVIHAAADVRFDGTLHKLLMINLGGTSELLKIAEKMKKLQAVSYISTAYSNCYRNRIDEEFYPPPVDPQVMLKLVENYYEKPDERLEVMQDLIIRPWPNTYTYSKALSEALVRQYGQKLPICVIRPTVVVSTYEDPIPGWCNNIYGLNGLLIAGGLGVLKINVINRKVKSDIVCADFVINSTLASMWVTHEDWKSNKLTNKDPEIYHVSIYQDHHLPFGEIIDQSTHVFSKNPGKRMILKPTPNSTIYSVVWKILTIYYHVIPGCVFDAILKFRGRKERLLPVYRKIQNFTAALTYFLTTEIVFTNSNMKRVLARMSKEDQELFPSDVRRFNWDDFVYDYIDGLKLYISRETLDDVVKARVLYRKLYIIHAIVLVFYYGIHMLLFYHILKFYNIIDYWKNTVTDTYEFLQNP